VEKALFKKPGNPKIYRFCSNPLEFNQIKDKNYYLISSFLPFASYSLIEESDYVSFDNPIALGPSEKDSSKEEFTQYIQEIQQAIANGEFQKVVAARTKSIDLPENFCFDTFVTQLTDNYPAAYLSVYSGSLGTFVAISPELLVKTQSNKGETIALAGTCLWDEKEKLGNKENEEQAFIGKHIEETLKKAGLAYEKGELKIIKAEHLAHFSNTYTFDLPSDNFSLLDWITKLHPTPAVGGYPYLPTIPFILAHEKVKRALYAGFSGLYSTQSIELAVNLRCAHFYKNKAVLYAGAGITAQSNAEAEWIETEHKFETMLQVLKKFLV
jgi:isochorismate synthase